MSVGDWGSSRLWPAKVLNLEAVTHCSMQQSPSTHIRVHVYSVYVHVQCVCTHVYSVYVHTCTVCMYSVYVHTCTVCMYGAVTHHKQLVAMLYCHPTRFL